MPRASPARPASNADHDTLSASPGAEKNFGNRKAAAQTLQTINFYSYFLETTLVVEHSLLESAAR
jgi:hypothetical protein